MGKHNEVPETAQLSMIPAASRDAVAAKTKSLAASPDRFLRGDPDRLFIGNVPLARYLKQANRGWVLSFRERLFEQDGNAFYNKYKPYGRKPYHPFVILGLILYGAQMGRWSLRELEDLAKLDLGAWWICGGLQPDHSTIGDFIHLHTELLTEEFFVALTSNLVKRLGSSGTMVAGDGTVIEAASSRFAMLKHEAAKQAFQKAEKEYGADSERTANARAVLLEVVARDQKRKRRGNSKHPARVCPTEPEAVVQPRKDGVMRPGYKPSILADKNRLILAQHVDTASEMAAVEPMFQQVCNVTSLPNVSLWDGNYNTFAMLNLSVTLDMDVLCGVNPDRKSKKKKKFLKADFSYDTESDTYCCPTGQKLSYRKSGHNNGGIYREYHCRACEGCAQRERCTKSKAGRSVLRYEGEELKEAMQQIMRHPAAKKCFRKRKAMVEPPFGDLRYRQGLSRFRRKGLKKVRVEFSLHCMAYNLRRAIRLEDAALAAYLVIFGVNQSENAFSLFHIAILGPNKGFVLTIEAKISNL